MHCLGGQLSSAIVGGLVATGTLTAVGVAILAITVGLCIIKRRRVSSSGKKVAIGIKMSLFLFVIVSH